MMEMPVMRYLVLFFVSNVTGNADVTVSRKKEAFCDGRMRCIGLG